MLGHREYTLTYKTVRRPGRQRSASNAPVLLTPREARGTVRRLRQGGPTVTSRAVRYAVAASRAIQANIRPLDTPLKLTFALTYWCQYRCKTCNIWQRQPADELSSDEVFAFIDRNPGISWLDSHWRRDLPAQRHRRDLRAPSARRGGGLVLPAFSDQRLPDRPDRRDSSSASPVAKSDHGSS